MRTHPRSRLGKWIVFGLLASCLFVAPGFAQEQLGGKKEGGKKDQPKLKSFLKTDSHFLSLFKKVLQEPGQSTVQIRCDDKNVALGTIVAADGWIITKASVVNDDPTVVLKDGSKFSGKIIGQHEEHDLSLIKIDAKDLPAAKWRSSKEAPVGFWTVSVGWGESPMALGVVSVATRNVKYPKNYTPQGVNNSGYMGVALAQAEKQAVIDQIVPNSGAAKAGLKVKDIIVSVSGKAVSDAESLITMLRKFNPGDKVVVRIKRGEDEEMELKVTLGKRPQSRGDIQNNMGSKLSDRIDGFPIILQHDGIVLPNECGGPLVDLEGRVIGVNISRAGRTESYAIPSEVIQGILEEMKTGKFALATNKTEPKENKTLPKENKTEPKENKTEPKGKSSPANPDPDRIRPPSQQPQVQPQPQPSKRNRRAS
jgi:serine protease Do